MIVLVAIFENLIDMKVQVDVVEDASSSWSLCYFDDLFCVVDSLFQSR